MKFKRYHYVFIQIIEFQYNLSLRQHLKVFHKKPTIVSVLITIILNLKVMITNFFNFNVCT